MVLNIIDLLVPNFNWVTVIAIILSLILVVLVFVFPSFDRLMSSVAFITVIWVFVWAYSLGSDVIRFVLDNKMVLSAVLILIVSWLLFVDNPKKSLKKFFGGDNSG